jgi:hypothetical protein
MKIFIGSSSNYVSWNTDGSVNINATRRMKLGRLVEALRKIGYTIEPWWEDEIFPAGKYLLDSLIIKSRVCDGGIFIFGQDDKVKIKGKSKKTPRHNVVLECGMFYGTKGRDRTLVFYEGEYSNLALPSDINGVLLKSLDSKVIVRETNKFFGSASDEKDYHKFTFYFNSTSIKEVIDKNYLKWSTKSLYVGTESARKWKAIETDKNYLLRSSRPLVKKFVKEIQSKNHIDFKKIDNIISLGPGCGNFDNSVVSEIYKVNNDVAYIPIDINPHLAFEASNFINDKNPKLRVPFAIIDDFEENYLYVGDIIKRKFNEYNQKNLFLMLGGTFSNLEGIESEINKKLNIWMDNNDYLLIDAFIKADSYSFANDKDRQVKGLSPSYSDLMTNACIKKYLSSSFAGNIKDDLKFYKEIKTDLTKYLTSKEEDVSSKAKYTEIDNTAVYTYNFNINNSTQEILIAKRYKFEKIKKFLADNFKLIYSFDGLKGSTELTSRGLFLLQKKH